jgi:hypothetical protein
MNGRVIPKIDRGALMRRAWAIFRETYRYPQIKCSDIGRLGFAEGAGQKLERLPVLRRSQVRSGQSASKRCRA